MAEALGIKEALSWVKKSNRVNIVVESDCLLAVQAIRNSYTIHSYMGR